jgi:hypothetical protein
MYPSGRTLRKEELMLRSWTPGRSSTADMHDMFKYTISRNSTLF